MNDLLDGASMISRYVKSIPSYFEFCLLRMLLRDKTQNAVTIHTRPYCRRNEPVIVLEEVAIKIGASRQGLGVDWNTGQGSSHSLRVPPLPGDDPLLLIRGLQSHHSGGNEPLPLITYVRCVEHGRMAQVSPYHTVCIVEGNFTYGAGGSVIHDEEDQDWGYIHIAGHDCLGVTQGYQQMGPIQKLGLPHQQIDVVLKHVMELFQGFMIAFSCLLLLLFQQVYQDLVLQPFDKDSFVSRPWCPCTSLCWDGMQGRLCGGKGLSARAMPNSPKALLGSLGWPPGVDGLEGYVSCGSCKGKC